jgi:hypothetical protein
MGSCIQTGVGYTICTYISIPHEHFAIHTSHILKLVFPHDMSLRYSGPELLSSRLNSYRPIRAKSCSCVSVEPPRLPTRPSSIQRSLQSSLTIDCKSAHHLSGVRLHQPLSLYDQDSTVRLKFARTCTYHVPHSYPRALEALHSLARLHQHLP